MSFALRKIEEKKQELYSSMLTNRDIENGTLVFWSSILVQHISEWDISKLSSKKAKVVKEIREAATHVISYNTIKENERLYALTELNDFKKKYYKEVLKRKDLEKQVKTLRAEIKYYNEGDGE